MTTATKPRRTTRRPARRSRRVDLHALSDTRFYTIIAYRAALALMSLIALIVVVSNH